jgi:uncharacterized lipoprotein YddW (UPF0748 family)
MKLYIRSLIFLVSLLFTGIAQAQLTGSSTELPLPVLRFEFRAAWVATVANIDWPSRKGLPTAALKAEAQKLIDQAKHLGLNALILQVRPSADAIYPSEIEPWTEFLTGEQGAPLDDPAFDPLQFWIDQSHAAGLQLHAWFNPYRAWHAQATGKPAATHVSQTRPDLVKRYGQFGWMDPGEADAAAHTLRVIADVVQRYDIDGVHMDDYFYPYPISSGGEDAQSLEFPDYPSWVRYLRQGGQLTKAEWRRDNVNRFVRQVYEQTKRLKPWLRVGISPFGIGKPAQRPAGITGFSQYDSLYADVEHWLAQGWMDYLAPQLYFKLEQRGQAFGQLLIYWQGQSLKGVAIWPGLFTSRLKVNLEQPSQSPWLVQEIAGQIAAVRRTTPTDQASGHIHFSLNALANDAQGVIENASGWYREPAAVPPINDHSGMNLEPPPAPVVKRLGQNEISVSDPSRQSALLAIWIAKQGVWHLSLMPTTECPCIQLLQPEQANMMVRGVSRTGQLSDWVFVTAN